MKKNYFSNSSSKIKQFSVLLLLLLVTFNIKAQYTLQPADVVITDGIITKCVYDFNVTDIIIPETIDGQTVIAIDNDDTFNPQIFHGRGITSVVFPSTLKRIGDNAFRVNEITSVELPDGLEYIGESAFSSNSFALTEVTIPNTVTFIGKYAFSMNLIKKLTLPVVVADGFEVWVDNDGNKYAGGTVVDYNSEEFRAKILYTLKDEDVELDENGIIISCSYDFENGNKDIIIPETLDSKTVTGIADKSYNGVFQDKEITSLQLPATIKIIGGYAFKDNKITSIIIPEGVEFIGNNAFYDNDLTNIALPNNITYIGSQSFNSNDWDFKSFVLPTLTIDGFEHWIDNGGTIYEGGSTVEFGYFSFTAKIVYTLTDDDVTVVDGIIEDCSYDFSNKYINIPETLDGQTVVGIKNEAEASYFDHKGMFVNKGIKDVKLPSTLKSIGDLAFYYNNLTKQITLPANVDYIGIDAFTANSSFEGVILPSPTKEGYVCENWISSSNATFDIGATVTNFFHISYTPQYAFITDIKENTEIEFQCFPNPVNDILTIKSENLSIVEVVNLSGVVVFKEQMQVNTTKIDMSEQAKGIYILRISNNNSSVNKKIVKQ